MNIYRIAKTKYINDLSGEGARLYGGRWNKKGTAVIYFSEHLSLCVLEMLTRLDYEDLSEGFMFLEAEIPSSLLSHLPNPEKVSLFWRNNPPISNTQEYSSNFLLEKNSLGFSIPSAVLPNERNIILNPFHKDFSSFKILQTGTLELDARIYN
ncbi:RES family NAD+ phosphorylase [Christiangramia forsetii]|uniref:RES domain-containing protein n=2 Tax=Christiangramia forsetii TaxID=411153 RepID=A0M4U1_CHRFK|nr:RES family NAD+ phosphorylase [Christiangramia forsetii]GGG22665.1 hypothetical protein GCM10011532_02130 [Christiangramia forsetii]CAL67636.1 conserved hypothetical protein [Christiangramia forsetii KT0803]